MYLYCQEGGKTGLYGYKKWLIVSVEQDFRANSGMLQKHFYTIDSLVVDNYALDYSWEQY